ncbi:MAG: hypothetical protein ABI129_08725, partial [Rhodanobacter sp.]
SAPSGVASLVTATPTPAAKGILPVSSVDSSARGVSEFAHAAAVPPASAVRVESRLARDVQAESSPRAITLVGSRLVGSPLTSGSAPAVRAATSGGPLSSTSGTSILAAMAPVSSRGSGARIASAFSAIPIRAQAFTLAAHPRLLLDGTTLDRLRKNAAANSKDWKNLKAFCDQYIGGVVYYPNGEAYDNLPNLGAGYEGEVYLPALLGEALCYQVLKTSNPTAAAPYGAKAVDILVKMSAPYNNGSGNGWNPNDDSGYAIRNYGVGMGLGYDWLYELLTPAQRTQVYTTANVWVTDFETNSFEYDHPQSNYFAGYFHAKAVIALATYDENPSGPAQWGDWLNNEFSKRVQPYYAAHLKGGGWPEGFSNYAPLGILNMSLPAREVKTATGIDLLHAAAPYTYPVDAAGYAMHFTWPSRKYFDDRDTNRSANNYQAGDPPVGTTQTGMFQQILGELAFWQSPDLGVFNQYTADVASATSNFNTATPWLKFLESDPGYPTTAVNTLPLSYFAQGMGAVAARSDWSTSASWMSFRAAAYTNAPAQGEQFFDEGSLALVRGNNPLLVNASGWVVHEPGGSADDDRRYQDNFGKSDGTLYQGVRQLYNIFYVFNKDSSGKILEGDGQRAFTDGVRTRVSAFEDGTNYVYVQAVNLEDQYRAFAAGPAVASWSRQIVYLRPNRFVVYDRTTEGASSYDQYFNWHFPASPVAGSAPAGESRLDVTYGGSYVGAMTTILPKGAVTRTVPLYPGSNPIKVWQVQVRPPNSDVKQNWLTVFDLSTSASKVASASPVTVSQGGILGVQLLASDGNSVVVSSAGPAGTPISGGIVYGVQPLAAYHVVTDLAPTTGYTVTTSANAGLRNISISLGGTSMSSGSGVLSFYVTADGVVQSNPPPGPVYAPLPISSIPVPGSPAPYNPGH